MSTTVRGDDPRWFVCKVYNHDQPFAWTRVLLVELLAVGQCVRRAMVRCHDGRENHIEVRGQLVVSGGVEDVLLPGVREQHDTHALRRGGLGAYRAWVL